MGEAIVAKVTGVDQNTVQIRGGGEERVSIPLAGMGFGWLPQAGDRVLLVPFDTTYACIGVLQEQAAGVQPGEIRLRAGGGYIHLRNDGAVAINGVIITKGGEILTGGEGSSV